MSDKPTVNGRSYCSRCGWQDAGEEHDWDKHPETIHGDIQRARKMQYGAGK